MAAVAYEPNLAFVAIAGNHATAQRAAAAIKKYAKNTAQSNIEPFDFPLACLFTEEWFLLPGNQ